MDYQGRMNPMNRQIEFFKPQKTLPVSVTGQSCSLNCAHCGGHFLKAMVPIEEALKEAEKRKVSSCLISGGCDKKGRVPIGKPRAEEAAYLKKDYKINMHVGMLEDYDIDEVCRLADVISLDIPVSTKVIREVYGLDYERDDYINLYSKLRAKTKVVPHICLGLTDSPELEDENILLEKLSEIKPDNLCYIIFTPVAGTLFENKKPPVAAKVQTIFKKTVEVLSETRIYLGCMRPGGKYRDEIDIAAVEAGLDGIVMPSKKAIERVKELGIESVWKQECCVF